MNKALGRITGLALGACIAHAAAFAQQLSAPGSAESAVATEALQEIVVTAQRREESAQHAAIAISTVGAADMAEANVTTPEGLTELVPALQISDQAGPYSTFYVRGVGSFAANALSDSAVAFNFDNVYIGRPSSASGFFYDLERVEVLKGPQGTLYGRNATGGAINVISHQPDLGRFAIDASAEYGNYSYFRVDGSVNVPIGDEAAVRLAVFHVRHNGYLSDGTENQDDTGGRLSFRIAPSESFNVSIVGDYFKQGGAGPGSTVIGTISPFATPPNFGISDRVGLLSPAGGAYVSTQLDVLNARTFAPFPDITSQDNRFWGVTGTVNWITPIGTVTVIPAYRDSSLDWQGFSPGFYLREIGDDKQTSFEARLASDDHAALRYVLGLFYYDENNRVPDFDVNQQADTSFQAIDTDTVSRAVYGRLTYALTPQVRVTGGVRYTKENKDFSGTLASNDRICVIPLPFGCPNAFLYPYNSFTPLPPFFIPGADGTIQTLNTIDKTGANEESASYSRVTWHAGADWDVTDHNLLYASVETGFKAGGFFFSSDNGVYQPEKITAYTIGSKNRFLDNRLQLNLEAYYWDYTDQQISHLGEDSKGIIIFPTENVGSARFKGAELEIQARPFSPTLLSADFQYNDGRYNTFVYHTPNTNGGLGNGTACPNIGAPTQFYTVNCSGEKPPFAPLWTINASAQQTVPLPNGAAVIGTARVHFQSDTLTALDFLPVEVQSSYALVDFELRYAAANNRFFVAGYVNNAFDRSALSFSYPAPFSLFVVGGLQPPRTYGIRAGVHVD